MFKYTLGSSCVVGNEAIHASATVFMDGQQVANVVQVVASNKVYWRIFDYDVDKKEALEKFFQKELIQGCKPNEVTFSRPFCA